MKTRLVQYQRNLKNSPKLYKVAEQVYESHNTGDSFWGVEAYVLAPVLCSYVAWVISEASNTGKKRLYFMARDGYLMYKTALIMCRMRKTDIECRYVCCSRYSLRSAEYMLIGDKLADYICLQGIDISFGRMMERAGLTRKQGTEVAKSLGKLQSYDEPMGYQEIRQLKDKLVQCELFMNFVRNYSCECYPEICQYLQKEGFADEIPYAVVDSGWTGSMQKSLGNILKSMGINRKLEGYYFGMYQIPQGADQEDYHTWFFSAHGDLKRKVYFNNNLFECIYSAPHGMTIGYKNGEPVFYEEHSRNQEKINAFEIIVLDYINKLMADEISLVELGSQKDVLAENLCLFMGRPTADEAEYFGSYLFCDDVVGGEDIPVARELSRKEIRDNFLLKKIMSRLSGAGTDIKESAWLEGSIALYGENKRMALLQCRLFQYIRYIRMSFKA